MNIFFVCIILNKFCNKALQSNKKVKEKKIIIKNSFKKKFFFFKLELSQRKVSDNLNHKQIMTGERRLARMWYAKYSYSPKKFQRRIKTSIFRKRSSYPGAKRKDSMKISNHSVLLFKSGRFVFRDLFFK